MTKLIAGAPEHTTGVPTGRRLCGNGTNSQFFISYSTVLQTVFCSSIKQSPGFLLHHRDLLPCSRQPMKFIYAILSFIVCLPKMNGDLESNIHCDS